MRHLDRKAFHGVYVGAIDALGSFGGPDAVDALKDALQQGDWKAPLRTRRTRASAAQALRQDRHRRRRSRRSATRRARGSRGVRSAARAELKTARMTRS